MKTWTLFFVILFLNIYIQRHPFTWTITDNGLPHPSTKAIVKNGHGFLSEKVSESNSFLQKMPDGAFKLYINEKKQKLTPITTDTRAEIISEQINTYASLLNNRKLEIPYFKRKSPNAAYVFTSAKINFTSHHPKGSIVETTLIKDHFI